MHGKKGVARGEGDFVIYVAAAERGGRAHADDVFVMPAHAAEAEGIKAVRVEAVVHYLAAAKHLQVEPAEGEGYFHVIAVGNLWQSELIIRPLAEREHIGVVFQAHFPHPLQYGRGARPGGE